MIVKDTKIIFLFLFCCFSKNLFSQEKHYGSSIDVNYLIGRVIPHHDRYIPYFKGNQGVSSSVVVSYNKHTFGEKEWQRLYNYPTYGFTFAYQNNIKPFLGDVYSLMFHYTYYLYKRKLSVKIADGLSLATNPYDKDTNKKNVFMTSALLNGFQLSAQYKEEALWNRWGFQIGAVFTHYSNGATKLKNQGLNSWYIQAGVNYSLGNKDKYYLNEGETEELDGKIHYNLVYRDGLNENLAETDYLTFHNLSFFIDKRLGKKRAIQGGIDFFHSFFLKEWINEKIKNANYSNKRVGLFVGHEYIIGDFSVPIQMGYYIYNPSGYGSRFYQRLGVTYSINKTFFFTVGLKTHWSKAEAIEYGGGIRF